MREIKFRGWYGEKIGMLEPSFNGNINEIFALKNGVYMQYTGLKDKNGKEIYEGDILKGPALYETPENTATTYRHWKVTYNNCSFYLGDSSIEEDIDWISEECEVVGSIYENAELLEN